MPSTTDAPRRFHFGSLLGLGFVTGFLDTLGVGSFATTSTGLKLGSVVEGDEKALRWDSRAQWPSLRSRP